MPVFVLTRQLVAQLSLVGMGFDLLGGCYLSYDLLGGKKGPLRTITRAINYVAVFFVGYTAVLGLKYGVVAAAGMGALLALEIRFAESKSEPGSVDRRFVLLLGFLRGLVLGLASVAIAGPGFGILFGVFSGLGLVFFYSIGLAPLDDYDGGHMPRVTRHRALATLSRAVAVSVGGLLAGFLTRHDGDWVSLGLRLGVAAGTVSALVGLASPIIEWRIENMPERRLGIAGLIMILIGVVFQSVQYWAVVLDWATN